MTESPKYIVLQKDNEIELREYNSYIQAELDVEGADYKSAIERGFNVLAGYIFGNNISRHSIAMTTPVKAVQSQKIAMTIPVIVKGDGLYTVAFIMPSAFSLENLPIPNDDRIRFNPVPAQKMSVIRFSGYFKQDVILRSKKRLQAWLDEHGLETSGDFIVAGYNPPWVPGFLARNEVLVEVQKKFSDA